MISTQREAERKAMFGEALDLFKAKKYDQVRYTCVTPRARERPDALHIRHTSGWSTTKRSAS
eukprot:2991620-Pyramimonas_sp.AAC.2